MRASDRQGFDKASPNTTFLSSSVLAFCGEVGTVVEAGDCGSNGGIGEIGVGKDSFGESQLVERCGEEFTGAIEASERRAQGDVLLEGYLLKSFAFYEAQHEGFGKGCGKGGESGAHDVRKGENYIVSRGMFGDAADYTIRDDKWTDNSHTVENSIPAILEVSVTDLPQAYTWTEAQETNPCSALGADWRLPSLAEMQLIQQYKGELDKEGTVTPTGIYWTLPYPFGSAPPLPINCPTELLNALSNHTFMIRSSNCAPTIRHQDLNT